MELLNINTPALLEGGNTKTEIENLALLLIEDTLEKGNPIELAEKIAATENLIKVIKDNDRYKTYVVEELGKYSGKYSTGSGTKIEVCEAGVKYLYDKCNDPVLADLYNQKIELEGKIKFRESFLKAVSPEGTDIKVEDELVTVYPPSKTSTTTYKVTLSK
jgi:hypothetical protein